jgi:pimeloyl-ACP methyl ester carboxylesterase
MATVRKWGAGPYPVAVIHGGPGALGEVAPVARELSSVKGILEPFQTEKSLDGQVEELKKILEDGAAPPVTLIGFSYGAWLSLLCAARYPALVKKLVLVGSPPFEERYSADITKTRLSRLSQEERSEASALLEEMEKPGTDNKNSMLARLGALFSRADAYDPLPSDNDIIGVQYDVFRGVWDEASRLRRDKELIRLAGSIQCPVIAIHGDYDPHLAEGVRDPLAKVLPDFRFILLKNCGHRPWLERNAGDEFYSALVREI